MMLSSISPLLRSRLMQGVTRDALLRMDPETAHRATIAALKLGLAPAAERADPAELKTTICGIDLPNPLGMAAGFDKDAEVPEALSQIGFGFAEVGTLTPRPQTGNPKPRLFRLPQAGGVINRMGFNNAGHEAAYRRLSDHRPRGVFGVNVGANKDSADFVADYVAGVRRFAGIADYLTVNVSSPNTPGLRDLQADEALARLLGEVLAERARAKVRVPVFLKLAPDLDEKALDAIARIVGATDLDGLIVSNTTVSRPLVEGLEHADERGGLSGRPLFDLATRRLAQTRLRVGDLPIIGVGGICSAKTARMKFEAGANAVQLYSALVFGGLEMLAEIKSGLAAATREAGHRTVSGFTGAAVNDWASGRAGL